MEEENNQKQEQTVEEEVAKEVEAEKQETTEVKAEAKAEAYVDLTSAEATEEKKFQETANTAEALDAPEKVEQAKEEVINETETTSDEEIASDESNDESSDESNDKASDEVLEIVPKEETETVVPKETANVIKDQDLIFVQYVCENPNCMLKFYINKVDDNLGDKLKCYGCGKKLAKKKRLMDVTLKQYKDYTEE